MFQVDVPKLLGRMKERGYTQQSLSDAIEISRETLRNYLNNYATIPYRVLQKMAALLCSDAADAESIFFAPKLT